MVTKEVLHKATLVLKRRQLAVGSGRIHCSDQAQLADAARLRSLEGICRHCPALRVEIRGLGRLSTVGLRCLKGGSPKDLYQWIPLGVVPECSDSRSDFY